MDEEEKIKKITRLLEQGCTMLASHHECGAPLFRHKGEILCPVCSTIDTDYHKKAVGETKIDDLAKKDIGKCDRNTEVSYCRDSDPGPKSDLASSSVEAKRHQYLTENDLQMDVEKLVVPSISSSDESELKNAKLALKSAVLSRMKDLALNIEREQDLSRLKFELDCAEMALKLLGILGYKA
jgi:UPF0148 protein